MDYEEITAAVVLVLDDGNRRDMMRAAGLDHAATFSWEQTAKDTLSVLQSAGKN